MSEETLTRRAPAPVTPSRAAQSRDIVLLGPQRLRPTLLAAVEALRVEGPLAVVTAGWQEREDEDQELRDHLRGRAVNLRLYQRMEQIFAHDPELARAHRERQQRLHEMRDLYNVRLAHAMDALKVLLARSGDATLLAQERAEAMQALRELDAGYLRRVVAVHEQFDATVLPAQRDSLARQRREIERELAGCAALAIAGGHVAVLLNRLRLLDVPQLLETTEREVGVGARRPVFAWSAGAMALGERVVLFHDAPPQGPGNAEVFDRGLGLCRDVLPLPHAWRRLRLDDKARVARFAQRFAPQRAIALEDGAQLTLREGGWTAGPGVVLLTTDGELVPQEGKCIP